MIKRFQNRFSLFLNILIFDGACFTLFLLNRFLPLSYVLFGLLGAIGAAWSILLNSIIQEEVEDENRGKVFSLMGTIRGPLSILAISLGTVCADQITAVNVLLISAGLELVISLSLRATKTYRQATQNLVSKVEA